MSLVSGRVTECRSKRAHAHVPLSDTRRAQNCPVHGSVGPRFIWGSGRTLGSVELGVLVEVPQGCWPPGGGLPEVMEQQRRGALLQAFPVTLRGRHWGQVNTQASGSLETEH